MAEIEKRRTVHGGKGSALCVELLPVRRCHMLGAEPWAPKRGASPAAPGDRPEGWAVYIRNPLPLLIRAEWPAVHPDGEAPAANKARSMALAKSRAAVFADSLADHLGCKVRES
jgi:hypothetical protein